MRMFFDSEVKAEAREREITNERPSKRLVELMGEPHLNLHAMRMGPGMNHLKGLYLPGGVKPEEFDYFVSLQIRRLFSSRRSVNFFELLKANCSILLQHELVVIQELVRIGSPGYMAVSLNYYNASNYKFEKKVKPEAASFLGFIF